MRSLAASAMQTHRFLVRSSFYPLVLSSLLACGIYGMRVRLTGDPLYIFLVWNLVLAWVPYVAALGVAALHSRGPVAWVRQLLLGVVWLVFLPNGPYIVTDIIHLRTFTEFAWWYDLGLIVAFAWSGMFLAIASLYLVQTAVRAYLGAVAGWLVTLTALGLSGLGVYLGRFLRWNSWDLLVAPDQIVADALAALTSRGQQPIGVIGMFSAFMLVCYLMFRSMRVPGMDELPSSSAAAGPYRGTRSNPAAANRRSEGVLPSVITARTSE